MELTDFFIGLTLVWAMVHIILGCWDRNMISLFGKGRKRNILLGLTLALISLGLLLYNNSMEEILSNGIYLGAFFMFVIYSIAAPILYKKLRSTSLHSY